jgi:hypothetical protein
MPEFVRRALLKHDLMHADCERPPYQQNDYLGWISRAKRQATPHKRLLQMLNELRAQNSYMKMAWRQGAGVTKNANLCQEM